MSNSIKADNGIIEKYEPAIGLEVHVELRTNTKIFCACSTEFGGEPNTHICPVCMALPGTLPVLNRKVLEYAVSAGLALGCEINRHTHFDRKNYFYADNPQNYQISQLYAPLCVNGRVEIGERNIRIHEIHMEEDAGKLIHNEADGKSHVDYNRAGVPLIEIVTEPDFRSADEVIAFLEKLQIICRYLRISDCKIQEGSMRVDVNLSVRENRDYEKLMLLNRLGEISDSVKNKIFNDKRPNPGDWGSYGTRTEMKNLSSFRAVRAAIENEMLRQVILLENGEAVSMETRRWSEDEGKSYVMRSKEDAQDYRYFPDPDLMPFELSEEWVDDLRMYLPELRDDKIERFKEEYRMLPEYDIDILTQDRDMADFFENTVFQCMNPKKVSNWLMGETMRLMKEQGVEARKLRFTPTHLAMLISMVEAGKITQTVAKTVFEVMFNDDIDPEEYVEDNNLATVSDDSLIKETVERVIRENPKSVEDYNKGKTKAIGFLIGQTMKSLEGKGDAEMVRNMIIKLLEA